MSTALPEQPGEPEQPRTPARPATRAGPGTGLLASAGPGVAVAAAVAVALTALSGASTFARLGLPDPGALVTYGLPLVRAVAESAAVLTVGALLLAAFLAPPVSRTWLAAGGYRAVRAAGAAAGVWAVASLLMVPLAVADAFGQSLDQILDVDTMVSTVPALPTALSWALTAVIALVVLALCRFVLTWGLTVVACGAAVAGLLPVALTGHSSSGGAHDIATNSLVLHVVAASLWVGGLVAVLAHVAAAGEFPGVAVRRFSRLALVAWIVLAGTGLVNALVRVDVGDLVTSTYGVLVLVKVVALIALGAFGAWHRARIVPAVGADGEAATTSRAALVRLGGVEVLLMFATVGVAVALGRTAPPTPLTELPTRVEALIGYPLDGPLTLAGVITQSRFDLIFGTGALVLAGCYLAAVRRLRRRGDAWPVGRTISWLAGCAALLFVTSSGIGRYAPAVFSVHMGQHMVLNMLVPILLVLGAPVTLLLRAVPPSGRAEPPGPREWVLAAVHSPVARVLTHPLVALALFVGSFYVLYFSGLFDVALSSHWAHVAMNVHFLLVGMLFFWPIVGIDPSPRQLPPMGRLGLLFVAIPLHAFFGVTVMSTNEVIGASFYNQLGLPWIDRLADQTTGGGLAWASGEVPMLLVLVALLVQWSRQDERTARRDDRRADRDGDADLRAYNAMLRDLDRRGARPDTLGSGSHEATEDGAEHGSDRPDGRTPGGQDEGAGTGARS